MYMYMYIYVYIHTYICSNSQFPALNTTATLSSDINKEIKIYALLSQQVCFVV